MCKQRDCKVCCSKLHSRCLCNNNTSLSSAVNSHTLTFSSLHTSRSFNFNNKTCAQYHWFVSRWTYSYRNSACAWVDRTLSNSDQGWPLSLKLHFGVIIIRINGICQKHCSRSVQHPQLIELHMQQSYSRSFSNNELDPHDILDIIYSETQLSSLS